MRQSWYFRLLGVFMLPLYATGAWIAPALQVCPMHGSPAAAHAVMDSANGMSGHTLPADAMPGMAGHDRPTTTQASSGQDATVAATDAPSGAHTHGCDCLGSCAGASGPAAPESPLALVAPAQPRHEPIELKVAEVVVLHLEHVLPFATAPPGTLV